MSFVTDLLVKEGISLANPLIVTEEELELQKVFTADKDEFKLVCNAVEVLSKKLAPHITGTSIGAQAALAFINDLQQGVDASAKANGVVL